MCPPKLDSHAHGLETLILIIIYEASAQRSENLKRRKFPQFYFQNSLLPTVEFIKMSHTKETLFIGTILTHTSSSDLAPNPSPHKQSSSHSRSSNRKLLLHLHLSLDTPLCIYTKAKRGRATYTSERALCKAHLSGTHLQRTMMMMMMIQVSEKEGGHKKNNIHALCCYIYERAVFRRQWVTPRDAMRCDAMLKCTSTRKIKDGREKR